MIYNLKLVLKSPLLVGGRKADSTFIESLDYIPGRVIRAAVAKTILAACPLFDPMADAKRRYWVTFAGGPECGDCEWKEWCRHFGEICFHDARPFGAEVLPLTTLGCKDHEDHPTFDSLPMLMRALVRGEPYAPKCPRCGGRVQRREGFHLNGNSVALQRRVLTRVGINPKRGVAEDRMLYTLRVINAQSGDRRSGFEPVWMQGMVHFPAGFRSAAQLCAQDLFLGAKTTSGLGRAGVILTPDDRSPREGLADRVRRFSARVVDHGGDGSVYVPVMLVSDGLLGLESLFKGNPHDIPTETYCRMLGERVWPRGSDFGAECVLVRAQHRLAGGYATWKPWDEWRLPAQLVTEKGAVFVFRLPGPAEAAYADLMLLGDSGVGRRCTDGYGQVAVAYEFTNGEGTVNHGE